MLITRGMIQQRILMKILVTINSSQVRLKEIDVFHLFLLSRSFSNIFMQKMMILLRIANSLIFKTSFEMQQYRI